MYPTCRQHRDRLELVVLDGERIVEEHHDAVACKVLERALVGGDQLAEHAVVLPQYVEQFLGRGGFGEGGEATRSANRQEMYARCPARSRSPS